MPVEKRILAITSILCESARQKEPRLSHVERVFHLRGRNRDTTPRQLETTLSSVPFVQLHMSLYIFLRISTKHWVKNNYFDSIWRYICDVVYHIHYDRMEPDSFDFNYTYFGDGFLVDRTKR